MKAACRARRENVPSIASSGGSTDCHPSSCPLAAPPALPLPPPHCARSSPAAVLPPAVTGHALAAVGRAQRDPLGCAAPPQVQPPAATCPRWSHFGEAVRWMPAAAPAPPPTLPPHIHTLHPADPAERIQPGNFDDFYLVTNGERDNMHPNDGGHRCPCSSWHLLALAGGGTACPSVCCPGTHVLGAPLLPSSGNASLPCRPGYMCAPLAAPPPHLADPSPPHPLGRIMANLVIHWMQRVLDDVAARPVEAWEEEEAACPLPIPMQQVSEQGGGAGSRGLG